MKAYFGLALILSLVVSPLAAQDASPAMTIHPSYIEDFLDYRLQIQRKIESHLNDYLRTYQGSVPKGRATFTYHVNSQGAITLIEMKSTTHSTVSALAHRAIAAANQQQIPFPESVRQRHTSGYFNQIAFVLR